MIYSWANVENPFFWFFWSGLFLGAAIDRVFRPRLRLDRWALVYIYLALVVLAATLAFVSQRMAVGGAGAGVGASTSAPNTASRVFAGFALTSLIFFLATTGIGFLVARFRLAVGVPAFVALVLIVVGAGESLRDTRPLLASAAEAGDFQVLAFHDGAMEVEINVPLGEQAWKAHGGSEGRSSVSAATSSYVTIHAHSVAAVVEVLTVPNWFFFLSATHFYRLDGLAAYDSALHRTSSDLLATQRREQAIAFSIPGIRVSQYLSSHLVPTLLQRYRIVVLHDFVVRVTPIPLEKD